MNAGSKRISFTTEGLPWKFTVNNWSVQKKKQREQHSRCIKKNGNGVPVQLEPWPWYTVRVPSANFSDTMTIRFRFMGHWANMAQTDHVTLRP